MQGSIRLVLGILLVFGGVGGMDAETATELQGILISFAGLLIMWSGARAMNRETK